MRTMQTRKRYRRFLPQPVYTFPRRGEETRGSNANTSRSNAFDSSPIRFVFDLPETCRDRPLLRNASLLLIASKGDSTNAFAVNVSYLRFTLPSGYPIFAAFISIESSTSITARIIAYNYAIHEYVIESNFYFFLFSS